MFKTTLIFVLLIGSLKCLAQIQKTDSKDFKSDLAGIILETEEAEALPYVHIFNKNTHKGTISDLSGSFSIAFDPADTIVFSAVGFENYTFTIPNSEKVSRHYFVTIKLNHSTFKLSPVTIFAFKDEATFKNDILNLKLSNADKKILIPGSFYGTPEPAKTKVYLNNGLACNGCITSILNLFNREVKESKKYNRVLEETPIKQEIYEKYNPVIVQEITGLNEEKLADFMLFCKISDDYILTANDYEIVVAVHNCYKEFLSIDN